MTPVRDREKFVAHIVNDFLWAIERGVERAELMHEGMVALWEAEQSLSEKPPEEEVEKWLWGKIRKAIRKHLTAIGVANAAWSRRRHPQAENEEAESEWLSRLGKSIGGPEWAPEAERVRQLWSLCEGIIRRRAKNNRQAEMDLEVFHLHVQGFEPADISRRVSWLKNNRCAVRALERIISTIRAELGVPATLSIQTRSKGGRTSGRAGFDRKEYLRSYYEAHKARLNRRATENRRARRARDRAKEEEAL